MFAKVLNLVKTEVAIISRQLVLVFFFFFVLEEIAWILLLLGCQQENQKAAR